MSATHRPNRTTFVGVWFVAITLFPVPSKQITRRFFGAAGVGIWVSAGFLPGVTELFTGKFWTPLFSVEGPGAAMLFSQRSKKFCAIFCNNESSYTEESSWSVRYGLSKFPLRSARIYSSLRQALSLYASPQKAEDDQPRPFRYRYAQVREGWTLQFQFS